MGLNGSTGGVAAALEEPDRGVWGGFTDNAIVLLEEAISMVTACALSTDSFLLSQSSIKSDWPHWCMEGPPRTGCTC